MHLILYAFFLQLNGWVIYYWDAPWLSWNFIHPIIEIHCMNLNDIDFVSALRKVPGRALGSNGVEDLLLWIRTQQKIGTRMVQYWSRVGQAFTFDHLNIAPKYLESNGRLPLHGAANDGCQFRFTWSTRICK